MQIMILKACRTISLKQNLLVKSEACNQTMKVNTSPPSATANLECDGVSHRTSFMYCKPNKIALDKNRKTTYHISCEGVGNFLVNRIIAIAEMKMPFHSLYNWEFPSIVLHCEQTLSTGGI